MICKVIFTNTFKRSIKRLKKRFRKVKNDVEIATEVLLVNPEIGGLIPKGFGIRKLRVRNSDLKKGKSGGTAFIIFIKSHLNQPFISCCYISNRIRATSRTKH
jgi:mRNA-degrading endonuclease RelE of RelBE toxin-antitoxin system